MATPQNIRYILYSLHLSIPHHIPTLSPTHPLLSYIFSFYFLHPLPSSHLFPLLSLTLSHISIPSSHFPFPASHIIYYRIVQCPYTPYSLPIHALVTSLYSFIPSSTFIHIPHLLFHMKHIDNDSYFHFHFHIIYYMYLCPLHIVSKCLLSSMNPYLQFTTTKYKSLSIITTYLL